jgi:hypothetical protein
MITETQIHLYLLFILQANYTSRASYGQTEDHSFGDHLISELVRVMPSSMIEASIVLCVFMTRVSQGPISLCAEHPVSGNINFLY